jgi:hypothetical protein
MTVFDALAKLARKNKRAEPDAEWWPQPIKPGDRRSAKAREIHSRARRVLATLPKKVSHHAPKIRWPSIGRRGGWQPPIGASVLDRVVRAMEPGAWYAVSDLRHLAGLPQTTQFQMFRHGYLTRRANPEYRPRMSRSEKGSQPKWLYTLTAAGKTRRRLLRLLT